MKIGKEKGQYEVRRKSYSAAVIDGMKIVTWLITIPAFSPAPTITPDFTRLHVSRDDQTFDFD